MINLNKKLSFFIVISTYIFFNFGVVYSNDLSSRIIASNLYNIEYDNVYNLDNLSDLVDGAMQIYIDYNIKKIEEIKIVNKIHKDINFILTIHKFKNMMDSYGFFSYSYDFKKCKIEKNYYIVRNINNVGINFGNYCIIINGNYKKREIDRLIKIIVEKNSKTYRLYPFIPEFIKYNFKILKSTLHLENYFSELAYINSIIQNSKYYYYMNFKNYILNIKFLIIIKNLKFSFKIKSFLKELKNEEFKLLWNYNNIFLCKNSLKYYLFFMGNRYDIIAKIKFSR